MVGLGNPGLEYENTRHNAGVWVLEAWARQAGVSLHKEARFAGRVATAGAIWLLRPDTYMNLSGRSVAALLRYYRVAVSELLVVHDDLDLPPGTVRLKQGGGSGGHNGLKDIIAQCGSPDFWRLRVGIGHPGGRQPVADFVLHRPTLDEQIDIDRGILRALQVMPQIFQGNTQMAMNQLHGASPSRNQESLS